METPLATLFQNYLAGTCSRDEIRQLMAYFELDEHEEELLDLIDRELKQGIPQQENADEAISKVKANLLQKIHAQPVRERRLWPRIAAAASIILAISAGGYFLLHKPPVRQQIARTQKPDIAPGKNQATLTLAGGQKIVLTKGLSGKLAQQGNITINVTGGQSITYTASAQQNNVPVQYNTLTTVRGEQSPYPLVLADGTKIWLDAASSVTFPTAFVGKERLVKITGQAYFEVTHNAAQPFKVMVKGQTIEDLGTSFNINAYDDEPNIQTTLLSGKVRLTNSSATATLQPGQVAIVSPNKAGISVKDVDTEGAVAWKNGYFLFDHATLESAMRQVARWYDVEVVYPDGRINENYVGSATRYANVSEALKVLETAGDVRFKIEGKKIIVLKK